MIRFLIPTAKEMKASKEVPSQKLSEKSAAILTEMSQLSTDELSTAYKIKSEQAEKEKQRWAAILSGEAKNYPAVELFNGLMYRHIKRNGLTEAEQTYLENHVLITSALYGVVPALSPMAPHRLDFLMKLKVARKTLKTHWKSAYDEALQDEDLIFSLLSSEFETVFSKEIREKMVTFKFMEDKAGQLKIHSTISKKARGAFLTALIEGQIHTVEQARKLSFAGFDYRPDLSSDLELVFVKQA